MIAAFPPGVVQEQQAKEAAPPKVPDQELRYVGKSHPKEEFTLDYVTLEGNESYIRESGIAFPGKCYIREGERFKFWNAGSTASLIEETAPVDSKYSRAAQVKYRNGVYWVVASGKIYQWDSLIKRWVLELEPEREFTAFEVAPDGRIILVGTLPKGPVPKGLRSLHPLDLNSIAHAKLLEIYEPRQTKPSLTQEYPEEIQKIAQRCRGLIGFNRTWAVAQFFVIYSPTYQWFAVFDSINNSTHWIDVPWHRLTDKGLQEQQEKVYQAAKSHQPVLLMGTETPQHSLQVVPQYGRCFLLWDDHHPSEAFIATQTKRYRELGAVPLFWPHPKGIEFVKPQLVLSELNLVEFRLEELRRVDRPKVQQWLDADLNLVPLTKFLDSFKPKPSVSEPSLTDHTKQQTQPSLDAKGRH